MNNLAPGFNGECMDSLTETYLLGNGYRAYDPRVMRFHCPDGWSPFGPGGINPYTYCVGDPVNRTDPSGHHSIWGWMGISAGLVLGAMFTPLSGGTSLAVALSVLSLTSAVVSAGLAISQQIVEETDPTTATALGWAALGTGLLSAVGSVALARAFPGAKSLAGLMRRSGYRRLNDMMGVITTQRTAPIHQELDIIGSIHGTDYAHHIGTIAQRWETTDFKSVMNTYQAMKNLPLEEINADEIYLYGSIHNQETAWQEEQFSIFNSKALSGEVQLTKYIKEGESWHGEYRTIEARKLKKGAISFIISHDANLDGPHLFPGEDRIPIRSRLSDVFRLKGRVLTNTTSIMSWSVFVQMPAKTGLPYELI